MFSNLEPLYPATAVGSVKPPQVVLPLGSSRDILLRGGPGPWVGKPSQYFRTAVSEDEEVARGAMIVSSKGEVNWFLDGFWLHGASAPTTPMSSISYRVSKQNAIQEKEGN